MWTYERLLFPQTPAEPYAPPNEPWPETSRQAEFESDPPTELAADERRKPLQKYSFRTEPWFAKLTQLVR